MGVIQNFGNSGNSNTGVSGAVDSFNGRTGAITAASGDYSALQIAFTPTGSLTSTNVQGASAELEANKLGKSLANGSILVGNASGEATAVTLSEDVTIDNAGVATVKIATDSEAGKVELATDAEALTGADTERALTPANVRSLEATGADVKAGTANKILSSSVVLDEDDLVSDSDEKIPTQQSVKKFVENRVVGVSYINQTAHGFNIPAQGFIPVYRTGTTWTASDSSESGKLAVAYITEVVDVDNFKLQQAGFVNATGHGLDENNFYFLKSDGDITKTEPLDISQPICYVVSANEILLLDQRAFESFSVKSTLSFSVKNQLDFTTLEPVVRVNGDTYINTNAGVSSDTAQTLLKDAVITWDDELSTWVEVAAESGMIAYDQTLKSIIAYDGTLWNKSGGSLTPTRLDSSSGDLVITLPDASTALQDSVLFILKDKTNALTLKPFTGQFLKNEQDGTFNFAAFDVGTQFIASNRSLNNWDITELGASTIEATKFYHFEGGFDNLDPTNANNDFEDFTLNDAIKDTAFFVDPSNEIDPNNYRSGDIITIPAGHYYVKYTVFHPNFDGSGPGASAQEDQSDFHALLRVNGTSIFYGNNENKVDDSYGAHSQINRSFTLDSDTTFELGYTANVDAGAGNSEDFGVSFTVEEIVPPTEKILTGVTDVEVLSFGTVYLDGSSGTTTTCPFDAVSPDSDGLIANGTGFSVENDGRYYLTPHASLVSVTQDITLSVNGVVKYTFNDDGNNTKGNGVTLNLLSTDVITLETDVAAVWANENTGSLAEDANASRVVVIPAATAKVVMPDALEVEDIERGHTELTVNTNYPSTYADVLTINIPSAGTYRVATDISYNFDVNSAPNKCRLALDGVLITGTEKTLGDTDVAAGNWRGSTHAEKVITVSGPAVLSLQAEGNDGGGANVIYASSDGNTTLYFEKQPQTICNSKQRFTLRHNGNWNGIKRHFYKRICITMGW